MGLGCFTPPFMGCEVALLLEVRWVLVRADRKSMPYVSHYPAGWSGLIHITSGRVLREVSEAGQAS